MADRIPSPYVGLVPYREADAQFFFGRERDVRRVIAQLFAARLTLLYGASGVGKSSLLRAGVVTELKRRAEEAIGQGERPDVLVAYFNRWQGDPLAGFRAAVTRYVGSRLTEDVLAATLARPTLTTLVTALVSALDSDLFLIFDQFEEFFLYHERRGAPGAFARDFADLATRPGLPVSLLISLRDDALSRLDHFKALIPNLFASYVRVTHLSTDDARRAIVEPVNAYNALPADQREWAATIAVEPALVAEVVDGVRTGRVAVGDLGRGQAGTPDGAGVETPYLQLVMTELWRYERARESTTLRASSLHELGGAEAIVQNHLDTTVAQLTPGDRDTCARMFQYLVTPSGTKIAYTAADLAGLVERPADEIELVLAKLSGSGMRILSPVAPPTDRPGPVRYEIYHDSLAQAILDWRRRYVAEQEKAELERKRLEQERELQEELQRQREERAQAERVARAERERAEAESLLVAEQQAAARRFKRVAAAAVLLAALALAASGFACSQSRQVRKLASSLDAIQQEARGVADRQAGTIADLTTLAEEQGRKLTELARALEAATGRTAATDTTSQAELDRLRKESALYKDQLARINAAAGNVQRPLQDPQIQTLQQQLDTATTRIRDLEAQLGTLPQLQADLARARDEARRLDAEVQALRGENTRLRTELEGKGGGGMTRNPEDARVREAIGRFEAAHNTADIARAMQEIGAVFPGYDLQQWARARKDYSSYALTIDLADPIRYSADGQTATVQGVMQQRYQLAGGTAQRRSTRMEFRLTKRGAEWVIAGTGAAAAGK